MKFIMVDGTGDPNKSAMFQDAIGAIYSLSYTLKFMIRQEQAIDYPVMALEGLWWTDDSRDKFSLNNKEEWKWTLMDMQPKLITDELFGRAVKRVEQKKSSLHALRKARLESFYEGLSAQIMHIGPYSAEEATIATLHKYIRERGYNTRGKHHEIYLGDPRRATPSKLKTILRHPVERR
ncbi:MAG: GyrI-like domain-containing protein [Thaumarchaeota archaeon]|nr:GyrI-like domain-containing protein [Nitrososphaerota archaeon]